MKMGRSAKPCEGSASVNCKVVRFGNEVLLHLGGQSSLPRGDPAGPADFVPCGFEHGPFLAPGL